MDADNIALASGFVSSKYISQGAQALSRRERGGLSSRPLQNFASRCAKPFREPLLQAQEAREVASISTSPPRGGVGRRQHRSFHSGAAGSTFSTSFVLSRSPAQALRLAAASVGPSLVPERKTPCSGSLAVDDVTAWHAAMCIFRTAL